MPNNCPWCPDSVPDIGGSHHMCQEHKDAQRALLEAARWRRRALPADLAEALGASAIYSAPDGTPTVRIV